MDTTASATLKFVEKILKLLVDDFWLCLFLIFIAEVVGNDDDSASADGGAYLGYSVAIVTLI